MMTSDMKPYPAYKDSGVEWLGEIPAHWGVSATKRVCRIVNGATPKSAESRYWNGDIPWITPEDFGDLDRGYILSSKRKITWEGYQDCGTTMVPVGSLVLSTRAPIGHLGIAGVKLCTNQGCRSLVFRYKRSEVYYFFQFLACRVDLEALGQGSTFSELSNDKLGDFEIAVPPLPEQRAIAAFLDRETAQIDALVAKKERLIELLQEKRTALISDAVTKGLDPDALLKDSGVEWLGGIPAHWEVKQLNRVVTRFVDYRGKTPEKVPFGVPLVTAKNIKNQMIDFSESQEYIREELYPLWMVRGFPELGDVVVTTEAPLGESAQITDTKVALAQRIILLKADKDKVTNEYLKYHFVGDSGYCELQTRATGSTAIGIKASHIKASLITIPPIIEQRAIAAFLDRETAQIDSLVAKVREVIDRLKELRTALISAAVTGKIDVREAAA